MGQLLYAKTSSGLNESWTKSQAVYHIFTCVDTRGVLQDITKDGGKRCARTPFLILRLPLKNMK
jgi:hypothetical protein